MKRAIKWALVASLTMTMLVSAATAWACSCMMLTPFQAFEHADAVVVAEVQTIKKTADGRLEAAMKVTKSYKGLKGDTVTVTTRISSSMCGVPFKKGASYVIFATDTDGKFSTSSCSQTRPLKGADKMLACFDAREAGKPAPKGCGEEKKH